MIARLRRLFAAYRALCREGRRAPQSEQEAAERVQI
jgi:hypothetical protein